MAEEAQANESATQQAELDISTIHDAAAALRQRREARETAPQQNNDSPRDDDRGEPEDDPALRQTAEEAPEDDSQQTPEDDRGTEPEDDAQERLTTLAELADFLDADLEDLMNLETVTKVNGEAKSFKLRDAITGYTGDLNLQRKAEELAEQRRELETQAKEFNTKSSKAMQDLNNFKQVAAAYLVGDYAKRTDQDWASLKESDPDRWKEEIGDYREKLAHIQEIDAGLQKLLQDQQKEIGEQFRAFKAEQLEGFKLQHRPEWADDTVFERAWSERKNFAIKELGITEEEFDLIADSRWIRGLDMAFEFHKLEKAKPAVNKKKKAAPKFTRRTTRRQSTGEADLEKAAEAHNANPTAESAAALLAANRKARQRSRARQ